MGYILPINSRQVQQYASRRIEARYFATVSRLQRVHCNAEFLHEYKEAVMPSQIKNKKSPQEKPVSASVDTFRDVKGAIYPNSANLSPAISHIVGKGITINTYV